MKKEIIQSAGGIVYFIDADGQPRYLLIKRLALSKKIERVAPKGKVQAREKVEDAAVREVSEETGIPLNQMKLGAKVGVTKLRNETNRQGYMDKDTTYFLINYMGDPSSVSIIDGEGYIGIYKWATIEDVLQLVYYQDMRELIRSAHHLLTKQQKKDTIKEDFMKKIA